MTAVGTSTAGDGVARLLLRYVLLAYGISWLLWSLAPGVGGAAGWVLAVAGAFGPAVAAGLVVRTSKGSLRGWLRPLLRSVRAAPSPPAASGGPAAGPAQDRASRAPRRRRLAATRG